MTGVVPRREETLARPRARKGSDQQSTRHGQMRPVEIPSADEDWHPIAKMIWNSLSNSGQSDFFQQSDWAYAYSLCDDVSRYKEAGRWNKHTGDWEPYRSPEMLKALLTGMTALLMTEGDRRRARIELDRPKEEGPSAAVLAIANYKDALNKPAPDSVDM